MSNIPSSILLHSSVSKSLFEKYLPQRKAVRFEQKRVSFDEDVLNVLQGKDLIFFAKVDDLQSNATFQTDSYIHSGNSRANFLQ
jgi:hypothetical protein